MAYPLLSQDKEGFLTFYKRRWKGAVLLAVVYLLFMALSERYIPHPASLFPASAVALSALFFEGIGLWPVVYIAALIGSYYAGFPLLFLITSPIAQTLQAVIGAYLMRKTNIDPLFRRSRDIFLLIGIVLLVSLIVPTIVLLTTYLSVVLNYPPTSLVEWGLRYIGNVLCLLVLTPFFLRWFAKPRFSRTGSEIIETVLVFAVLIAIDFVIFVQGLEEFSGIPLVYFMLIPLFWIALRLRPRFVTLALVITSMIAVGGLYVGIAMPAATDFSLRLFQIEEFIIVLAIMFFIIVSLEEDRRLSSNLLRSQVHTLENAVARISSESSAKNDFIAILAHELRNPLAPVMSSIDILKLTSGRSTEEMETLSMMEDRMQTVRRLLDDLLDISRIAEGKLTLKKERVNLETIIKRANLSTMHHLKERHQSLVLKGPKQPFFIKGDPVRLEQIFSNLLTNASKYSKAGGQISITVKKSDGFAEIAVSDHGVGLKADVIDTIFTPFQQAGPGLRSKKGLGIGLALVRSFAEMHGGDVVAASAGPGKGSTFTVRLPLMQEGFSLEIPFESIQTKVPEILIAPEIAADKKASGPSVLVVDDNDVAAWSMGRLLELKGCTVSYAYDGRQAIEQVEKTPPDIILLDLGLPDQDGYGVAKAIRARGFKGRLIALTGFSTEDAKAKGRDAGFEYYLVKPAGFADLKRVIPEIA